MLRSDLRIGQAGFRVVNVTRSDAKQPAYLSDGSHRLDSLVHDLAVILLWAISSALHLKSGVLQRQHQSKTVLVVGGSQYCF